MYRAEFRQVLKHLRRGKFLGQEVELNQELTDLDRNAKAAAAEIPQQAPAEQVAKAGTEAERDVTERVIELAATSPKAGLMLLSSEIERLLRDLMAGFGYADSISRQSVPSIVELVNQRSGSLVPPHLAGSVRQFWEIRNKIVHGGDAGPDEIIRTIDSGIVILKALSAIPRETNVVRNPGAEVFEDAKCLRRREGVAAVVLDTMGAGGVIRQRRVYPTTHKNYQAGQRVSWEWNLGNVWGESWYKDPESGTCQYGWTQSGEFIGRPLGGNP